MIPSGMYLQKLEKARAFMTGLKGDDKRFHRTVIVHHQDGSTFILTHAFVAFDEKDTFCVIPEHHDVHLFYKQDCHDWTELERAAPLPRPRKKRGQRKWK